MRYPKWLSISLFLFKSVIIFTAAVWLLDLILRGKKEFRLSPMTKPVTNRNFKQPSGNTKTQQHFIHKTIADRLRSPDPVPFGTCICSNVETILSWTCHVYGPFEFRTSLGTSILFGVTTTCVDKLVNGYPTFALTAKVEYSKGLTLKKLQTNNLRTNSQPKRRGRRYKEWDINLTKTYDKTLYQEENHWVTQIRHKWFLYINRFSYCWNMNISLYHWYNLKDTKDL